MGMPQPGPKEGRPLSALAIFIPSELLVPEVERSPM